MGIVSTATAKGPREGQEDRVICLPQDAGCTLVVMDGHNGSITAEYCYSHIIDIFFAWHKLSTNIEDVLLRVVEELHTGTQHHVSGSTLTIAYVDYHKDVVTYAIIGDSPIIVLCEDGNVAYHIGHNVRCNQEELAAGLKLGATTDGIYLLNPEGSHGLQLSRALGDARFGQYLNRIPEIHTVQCPRKILVATDGVINSSVDFAKYPRRNSLLTLLKGSVDAEKVLDWAKENYLTDNATAAVWQAV